MTKTTLGGSNIDSNIDKSAVLSYPEEAFRPFVTVTYAQTLDGMIAAFATSPSSEIQNDADDNSSTASPSPSTTNLKISCDETFLMTHALRSIHDAILIGGNTLYTDNPRLNNRLWGTAATGTSDLRYHQPIPVILDTELRHILKMVREGIEINSCLSRRGDGGCILVCCSQDAYEKFGREITDATRLLPTGDETDGIDDNNSNAVRFVVCKRRPTQRYNETNGRGSNGGGGGSLDLESVLLKLHQDHGIASVMVEGGSSVLSAFVSSAKELADCVCVTIAPKMMGGVRGLSALGGTNLIWHSRADDADAGCDHKDGYSMLEFDTDRLIWTKVGSDCVFLAPCSKLVAQTEA